MAEKFYPGDYFYGQGKGRYDEETHCGGWSWFIGCVFFPCIICCPVDKRRVWIRYGPDNKPLQPQRPHYPASSPIMEHTADGQIVYHGSSAPVKPMQPRAIQVAPAPAPVVVPAPVPAFAPQVVSNEAGSIQAQIAMLQASIQAMNSRSQSDAIMMQQMTAVLANLSKQAMEPAVMK